MKPDHEAPPIPPMWGLFAGILAVSTASIFIRFAQKDVPSLVIAAFRLTLATLALTPVVLFRRSNEIRSLSRGELVLAFISGSFLSAHFATWISSLEYTSVASSVVLVSTSPLWVALLSPIVLKEPLTRPILTGIVIAMAGGIIVGLSDTCRLEGLRLACPSLQEFLKGKAVWGDLLALAGAFAATGYLLIGRRLRGRISLLTYIFLVYGVAAIILTGTVIASGMPVIGYSTLSYVWLALLAFVPQLIGHSSFNWALRYLSAAYVSVSTLGEPIGSTILAVLFLREWPSALKVFGAILILLGISVASIGEKA